jgi:hypothetical protein
MNAPRSACPINVIHDSKRCPSTKSVTHVSGINCDPCVRNGPAVFGAPDEMKLRTAISLNLSYKKSYYAVSGAFARVRSFRN